MSPFQTGTVQYRLATFANSIIIKKNKYGMVLNVYTGLEIALCITYNLNNRDRHFSFLKIYIDSRQCKFHEDIYKCIQCPWQEKC